MCAAFSSHHLAWRIMRRWSLNDLKLSVQRYGGRQIDEGKWMRERNREVMTLWNVWCGKNITWKWYGTDWNYSELKMSQAESSSIGLYKIETIYQLSVIDASTQEWGLALWKYRIALNGFHYIIKIKWQTTHKKFTCGGIQEIQYCLRL